MIQTILRTIFFYFFITFAYRIMGKREVGQLGVIDLIVSILIAELVAISIENYHDSILLTVLPISLLVILELLLAYISLKSRKFNKLFCGQPTVIINDGQIEFKNLISERYSLDDLLMELRQKGIYSLSEVQYALLEPSGKLSIFTYNFFKTKQSIPLPLVVEGVIQRDTLKYLNKDIKWLMNILEDKEVALNSIYYAFYNQKKIYLIKH